jgi:hypothetical protein
VNEKSNVKNNAGEAAAQKGIAYKWIALSNVTLASLMGMINAALS